MNGRSNLDFYLDFYLLIHENLLILRDRPELNSRQSSIPLVLFYVPYFIFLGLRPWVPFRVAHSENSSQNALTVPIHQLKY